jgi:hypothetical protein
MAQRLVTESINTPIPGAYPEVVVRSTPVGIGAGGAIVILGEADSGPAYDEVDPKRQFFTPAQTDRVQAAYTRGSLVDAAEALASPSNDANIQGSVSRVYFLKTNHSDTAEAEVAPSYGTMRARTSGKDGNKISYEITETQEEMAPAVTGDTIDTFGAALDGAIIVIRLNGEAETTVELSADPNDHSDITTLVAEIDALLPAGVSVSDGGSDNLAFEMDADATAHSRGWGRSLEISGDEADLSALGLTAALSTAAAEPEQEIRIVRQDIGVDQTVEVRTAPVLMVGYLGTEATLSITGGALVTSVTGGTGDDINISLSDFSTIGELAAFIDSKEGYTAMASSTASQRPTSDLDGVTTIGIATSIASSKPGRIKRSKEAFRSAIGTSSLVTMSSIAAEGGLPDATAGKEFLSGGSKGHTTGLNVVQALAKAESLRVNFIVPLFSRDASEDIASGETDPSSTYTIDAVHAAAKDHTLKMSTILMKRNRISLLSHMGDFQDTLDKAGSLASFRVPLTFQSVDRLSGTRGTVHTFQPWMSAVVAAGMQSAGFYRAIVKKYANVVAVRDPEGFDSGNPGDVETALEGGLLFMEEDNAGNRWVSDQTTYGIDTNFVYNSLQAVYASDRLSIDLSDSTETRFTGQSLADVDLGTVDSFVREKMGQYKTLKLIAASDDAPLGYRGLKVRIAGPVLEIRVEVKLATAIYFIPIRIEISQVELNGADAA